MFSLELCEIFKNTFFASDYFSKYESLYMIAANHIWLSTKCLENIQEHIYTGFELLRYKFRKTKDWLNPHND